MLMKMGLCGEPGFLRGIRLRQREAAESGLEDKWWVLCPGWDWDAVGSGAADPLSGSLWCPLFDFWL